MPTFKRSSAIVKGDSAPQAEEEIRVVVERRAAPPIVVSQHSAPEVLGLDAAAFLRLARDHERAGGRVARRGKLVLVEREAFVSWLFGAHEAPRPEARDDADALARELGLAPRGGQK